MTRQAEWTDRKNLESCCYNSVSESNNPEIHSTSRLTNVSDNKHPNCLKQLDSVIVVVAEASQLIQVEVKTKDQGRFSDTLFIKTVCAHLW